MCLLFVFELKTREHISKVNGHYKNYFYININIYQHFVNVVIEMKTFYEYGGSVLRK